MREQSENLYRALLGAGVDVAIDDRGLRPGPMFADAELIGIPHRVTIGDKSLANAQFESETFQRFLGLRRRPPR